MNNYSPSVGAAKPWLKWMILATCCLSLFLVTMDVTIVNVALPSIRKDLGAHVSGLQWSIDAYTVVVGSLLLLSGSAADRYGRKRTFQVGLAIFTFGSLLCSAAPNVNALIGARVVQALGGSMMNPVAVSIIANVFTNPTERARALGIWGAVFGVSMAAGPLLGGFLVESIGWRSIFWVNVPIGIAAIFLTRAFVPESRADKPRPFDLVAQALVIVALLSLTSAVIDGRHNSWSSWTISLRFALSFVAFVGLIAWEAKRPNPMLDLRFFRSLPFSGATVIAVLAFAGFSGFLFLNSLYLQEARGLHASAAGMMTMPIAVALMICSPLSGRLVGAGHARIALVLAGSAIAIGALLLTGLTKDMPLWRLALTYAVFGVGMGSVNAPITNTAVAGMPRAQAGLAAAIASTSRQVGTSLGVALAGSLAGSGIDAAHRADFADATHNVFWLITCYGVGIVALGLVSTGARAKASAKRVAFLLDPVTE